MTETPGYIREVERLQRLGNTPPVEVKAAADDGYVKSGTLQSTEQDAFKALLQTW